MLYSTNWANVLYVSIKSTTQTVTAIILILSRELILAVNRWHLCREKKIKSVILNQLIVSVSVILPTTVIEGIYFMKI